MQLLIKGILMITEFTKNTTTGKTNCHNYTIMSFWRAAITTTSKLLIASHDFLSVAPYALLSMTVPHLGTNEPRQEYLLFCPLGSTGSWSIVSLKRSNSEGHHWGLVSDCCMDNMLVFLEGSLGVHAVLCFCSHIVLTAYFPCLHIIFIQKHMLQNEMHRTPLLALLHPLFISSHIIKSGWNDCLRDQQRHMKIAPSESSGQVYNPRQLYGPCYLDINDSTQSPEQASLLALKSHVSNGFSNSAYKRKWFKIFVYFQLSFRAVWGKNVTQWCVFLRLQNIYASQQTIAKENKQVIKCEWLNTHAV